MTRTALVLAAHGSRHEPAVNEQVRDWAAQIAEQETFDEVAVAFHQGAPAFCEILDGLRADDVTVVPVMTSAGYYSDTVLPRELAKNTRYDQLVLRHTPPLGLHQAITGLIEGRMRSLLEAHSMNAKETTIAIVGHGTPRHPASRGSTLSHVEQLRAVAAFGEVVALFLDDQPAVEQLLVRATLPNIVVVPFLIAAGPHATRDLPRRIGMRLCDSDGPPYFESLSGRLVVCDIPFGLYPQLPRLIFDLAMTHRLERGACMAREVA